jgi:LCP family protein required for cell wall assembly
MLADAILPGLGHLLIGARRSGLALLVPTLGGILLLVLWLGLAGPFGVLASLAAPGALTVVAAVNVGVALWRAAAVVDTARRARVTPPAASVAGMLLLAVVLLPHLQAARTIDAANGFLDSLFARAPTATPRPSTASVSTPTPMPSVEPSVAEPSPSPAPSSSAEPSAEPFPSGDNGTLPLLGASVPWARPSPAPFGSDGRFDLLLLGSDAGSDRWSRRTDVMLLVEVDTRTGAVAMVGLPRNLVNAPYPAGAARNAVACGCQSGLLNEMYVEASARHPWLWPGATPAIKGIGAVRSVVSELTGRPIDAVLIVDLMGVVRVVDALGGVDIDAPAPVVDDHYPDPIKGTIHLYIPAGPQHLDGRTALAYARSRHQDSDYGRMERQQTLLLAMRAQLSPASILSAPALFAAARGAAWTDLTRDDLPALIELFGKAAHASVKQLRIVPPVYPTYLNIAAVDRIRRDIAALLPGTPAPARAVVPRPVVTPRPSPSPSPSPTQPGGPSASPSPSPGGEPSASPSPSHPPTASPTVAPSPAATPPPTPTASGP